MSDEIRPGVCKHGSLRRSCEICDLSEDLDAKDAEIDMLRKALGTAGERINAHDAEIERLRESYNTAVRIGSDRIAARDAEIEWLEKALEQAVKRADLRLPVPGDGSHCELTQRLPVWPHHGAELTAYLKEKEKQGL